MSKPREFWICELWNPVLAKRVALDFPPEISDKRLDVFHVIEYSAYKDAESRWVDQVKDNADLIAERDQLRAENERLNNGNSKLMIRALKAEADNIEKNQENAKLRAALETIYKAAIPGTNRTSIEVSKICLQALASTKESKE